MIKFTAENVFMTNGINEVINNNKTDIRAVIQEHTALLSINTDEEDKKINIEAVKNGGRVLTIHKLLALKNEDIKFHTVWVISYIEKANNGKLPRATETKILLPEEY